MLESFHRIIAFVEILSTKIFVGTVVIYLSLPLTWVLRIAVFVGGSSPSCLELTGEVALMVCLLLTMVAFERITVHLCRPEETNEEALNKGLH